MFSPETIIAVLNYLPPEVISLCMMVVCGLAILTLLRFFGLHGLYMYIIVAVICGNIQVLKATQFFFSPEPVALGTIVFASTYMCTDIITEYFGPACARRAVLLSFAAMLLTTIFMILTLGWQPLPIDSINENFRRFSDAHNAMLTLFTPVPAIFCASIVAYIVSQYNDIWLFHLLRRLSQDKHLWLRTNISTMLSALVDNTIFSVLAWVILSPIPTDLHSLIYTYIFGTYVIRIVLAIFNTPFVYLAKQFLPTRPLLVSSDAQF